MSDVTLPARGLLFDNDGVLVDSEVSVVSSWSRWALDHDLDPAEVMAAVPGRRAADTVALFVDPAQVAGSTARITRYELDDVATTTAVPGVLDLVPQLRDVPWAVVTSGVRELATARLRAAGVPLPEVVVTAEDVTAGKPDPEGYASAAARLGLAAWPAPAGPVRACCCRPRPSSARPDVALLAGAAISAGTPTATPT
jgi:sugar-phosphatase